MKLILSIAVLLFFIAGNCYCGDLWSLMPGANNGSKLVTLQNGIALARNTFVGHACLHEYFAARDPTEPTQAARWSTALCCFWNPSAANTSITNPGDCVYEELTDPNDVEGTIVENHAGLVLTTENYNLVRDILCNSIAIAGGQAITGAWAPACKTDLDTNMYPDLVIVTPNPKPCRVSNSTYNWQVNTNLNINLFPGEQITFIWSDSNPHSVQDITTSGPGVTYYGIGGGTNSLASATTCSASDISFPSVPTPCNYFGTVSSSAPSFNYSKLYNTAGTYLLHCNVHQGSMTATVTVSANQGGTGSNGVTSSNNGGASNGVKSGASVLENFINFFY